ncbi:translin-associated protein X [Neocloeon triangulifer]|uniref:translin-associated protein X n=1 Tax=Neocloeon triangulifer TaxID=2078957 RepID=UPI00286EE6BD|nr:translin-associated protein X [Neocloeon triangulifer]
MSYRGNRRGGGGGGRRNDQKFHRDVKSDPGEEVDESSEVVQTFRQFAKELDAKHDKYERLVKLSRDVTIESKRIIFLIHTIGSEDKKEQILSQAKSRLKQVEVNLLQPIAKELAGEDIYQFIRAFSPGIQEYVEAKTFCCYMESKSIPSWTDIQQDLTYSSEPSSEETPAVVETLQTPMLPTDFMLGLGDLTGELMRRCINCVGMGQLDSCQQLCIFLRLVYKHFLGTNCIGYKEMGRKSYTLRQSLLKTENACYTIHVRGSEVPKHLLAQAISMPADNPDDDEGFY